MPKKKSDKNYFTQETEDAIVEYNKETDQLKRNIIYEKKIHKAFDKLAENIINTFKFSYFDMSFEDIKHEVVSFMVLNIDKYKQGKGKAFSYFSIVAKNYLILNNNNNYKKLKTHYDLEVVDTERDYGSEISSTHKSNDDKEFLKLLVVYLEDKIYFIFNNKKELLIANCILELCQKIDTIESFNKKAIYVILREMTGAKTQQITKVLNKMKSHYGKAAKEFKKRGDIQQNFFTYL